MAPTSADHAKLIWPFTINSSLLIFAWISLDNTMGPRSQLEIFTSSVLRLVNEEASYHRELKEQTEHVQRLEKDTGNEDENREYMLKQEVRTTLDNSYLGC